jgi:hypothetical protein
MRVGLYAFCARPPRHTELKEFIPSPRTMMKGSGSNEFGLAVLGWEREHVLACEGGRVRRPQ